MGFRSAIKRGGGGFLNNVDGVITSYEFVAGFNGKKKEWIHFVPSIKVDGADDDVSQHLFLGGADRYEISDDGQELTMVDESPVTFGFSTPFGRFMDSLIEKGFDEDALPNLEDGEALELSAIVGPRFRFKQEVDVQGNEKRGKRKVKGKDGKMKEYDRTNTVIDAVLGAAAGKTSTASKGKGKKQEEEDPTEEAKAVLMDILEKGPVNRKNLSLPVTKALMKNANKDELKKLILSDDFIESEDGWSVDKKGNLEAA